MNVPGKNTRMTTGRIGEDLAVNYLRQKGFTIVMRNYRRKCGEIDIIAKEKKTLVFIEVKTRRSSQYGSPFEAVTWKKQRQIARTAQDYLCRNNLFHQPARFDVIGITLSPSSQPSITMIQNAFELPEMN